MCSMAKISVTTASSTAAIDRIWERSFVTT